eukprot:SAG22_NODE_6137_length_893_cov_65.185139_1_plen_99_part_10
MRSWLPPSALLGEKPLGRSEVLLRRDCDCGVSGRSPLPPPPPLPPPRRWLRVLRVDRDGELLLMATVGCESSGTARKGRETEGKAVITAFKREHDRCLT